jgi:uncharacterized protein YjbJ (UPF0337 family)
VSSRHVPPRRLNPGARAIAGKNKKQGDRTMSAEDKAKNTAEQAKGKVKETAGKVTGNESLEAEGHGDQAKGDLKQAGEKVKDIFKN